MGAHAGAWPFLQWPCERAVCQGDRANQRVCGQLGLHERGRARSLFFGEVFRWNEFLGAAIIVLVIVANLASDAFDDGFLVALVRHRNKERA